MAWFAPEISQDESRSEKDEQARGECRATGQQVELAGEAFREACIERRVVGNTGLCVSPVIKGKCQCRQQGRSVGDAPGDGAPQVFAMPKGRPPRKEQGQRQEGKHDQRGRGHACNSHHAEQQQQPPCAGWLAKEKH